MAENMPKNPAPAYAEDEIDLFELWNGLVAEKWLVFSLTMICVCAALIYVWKAPKLYEASATVQVQQIQMQQIQMASQENMGNSLYASIENADKTAALMNGYFAASISAPKKSEGILILTAVGPDKEAIVTKVQETYKGLEERYQTIFESLRKLGAVEVLPTQMIGKVSVSANPVKPKSQLILAVAAVLGLMLGVFIALIRQAIKKRKTAQAEVV
jgi:uncharacterized protein involved in exopolysaccharide biosynthesis